MERVSCVYHVGVSAINLDGSFGGGFIRTFNSRLECDSYVQRVKALPELLKIDFVRSYAEYKNF